MKRFLVIFIINAIICFIIIILGILTHSNPRLLEGYTLSSYSNDYCQEKENENSNLCKNKYKTKKFILLLIDGTAYDSLQFLSKSEIYNLTKVYRNYDLDLKITGSNFETMFTGKYSRNYQYKPFNSDNLFKQLHNANYNLSYLGDTIPLFKFLDNENNIELNSYMIDNEEISFSNLCDDAYNIYDEYVENYLKNNSDKIGNLKISLDEMYNHLNQYFKNSSFTNLNMTECLERKFDISKAGDKVGIIYYTTVLDHHNHMYSKNHYKTRAQAYSIDSYLNKILLFIKEHSEYSLIICSDHGGNIFPGNDEIIFHGSNTNGNEGIFVLYNKEILNNKFQNNDKAKFEYINRYHYAPSFPLIIQDINIPLESIEMPILFENEKFWEDISINSKAVQIINYMKNSVSKFPSLKNKFDKYNNDIQNIINDNKTDYESKKEKLLNYNKKIVDIVKVKLIPKHYYVIFVFITLFFIVVSILEVYFMLIILKRKDKDLNINNFSLMILSLFFPMLIIFLPDIYSLDIKLNFIILTSCIFVLIPLFKSIKKLGLFPYIIIFINIISFLLFRYRVYIRFKEFLKGYYQFKIGEVISFLISCLYIFLYLRLHLTNYYFYAKKKFPVFLISLIYCLVLELFIFLFHITKPFYFEGRNKFIVFNVIIYIMFLFLFIICIIIPKKGKKEKKKVYVLTKVFIILFQTYVIEDSEKLMILLFLIPLFEYFTYVYESLKKNVNKFFLWQIYLIFFEIFYLLIKETFEMKSHPNLLLRDFSQNGTILKTYLITHLQVNLPLILYSYLFEFTYFQQDKFINSNSMLMRYISYIRTNMVYLYFIYNLLIKKNEKDVIKLFFYSKIYSLMFAFDTIYVLNFYIWGKIKCCRLIHHKIILLDEPKESFVY